MAQLPIREYDAKRLRSVYSDTSYGGILVEQEEQIDSIVALLENIAPAGLRVVKPDQLFGKRGKYGLVGVKLTTEEVKDRLVAHWKKEVSINGVIDILETFLIEPFVPHEGEWYLSLGSERDADILRFSALGGIDIEENRSSVREVRVGVLEQLGDDDLAEFDINQQIKAFIKQFFQFFKQYGFTSLEVNPFVVTPHPDSLPARGTEVHGGEGVIHCLDMVAKVDSCEAWRQKEWEQNIRRVKPFGTKLHPSEAIVASVDEKTGASLKLTVINPEGRLWFLLGGGGASVIVMDTLTQRGLMHEVANYGELSGNPDEESNRAYVRTLIDTMLANGKSDQYLCLVGGIANFTDIVALVKPLCVVLEEYASVLVECNITILMRRGGLRVEQAMQLLEKTCTKLGIGCKIYDDEQYLTKVFDEVKW